MHDETNDDDLQQPDGDRQLPREDITQPWFTEPLAEDNDRPAAPVRNDDIGGEENQASDSGVDSHERYDEGLDSATGLSDQHEPPEESEELKAPT